MPIYYGDSSAIIKRHVQESGSGWTQTLLDTPGNMLVTAHITKPEIYSALNRRRREGSLSDHLYRTILTDFEALCAQEYALVELDADVIVSTKIILERYALRAYDAVQLASALIVDHTLIAQGMPSLTFLSADSHLLAAAQAEGLLIENPNAH